MKNDQAHEATQSRNPASAGRTGRELVPHVHLDWLTPTEQRYLRAMAEIGPGPYSSGDIAHSLGQEVLTVAPTRSELIDKGMIYGPAPENTGFAVPLCDPCLRRVMPTLN